MLSLLVLQMVAGVTLALVMMAGVAMAQTPTPGAPAGGPLRLNCRTDSTADSEWPLSVLGIVFSSV